MIIKKDHYSKMSNPECFDPYRENKRLELKIEEKEGCLESIIHGCGCGCLLVTGGVGFLVYGIYKLVF